MDKQTSVLSPECEAELATWEMHSQADSETTASIYDCDGDYRMAVTRQISAFDLRQMLRYGQRQHKQGQQHGSNALAYSLRKLLNAAPLEL